jgi:hypothetical protein
VKLYCLLPSWDTSLTFYGEVRDEEFHGSRDPRTNIGGLSLGGNEEFSW